MIAKIFSAATVGLDGEVVEVEVDALAGGLHTFTIVGLPDAAIKEARDRVSAAIKNTGAKPVHRCGRITVNLAPADLPKNGALYDLPLALGIMVATRQVTCATHHKMFLGEMALDGAIRPVHGVLPMAILAKERGYKELYVPEDNAAEAAIVEGITVYGVPSLAAMIAHLEGRTLLRAQPRTTVLRDAEVRVAVDMAHVRGQQHAKRALEIAAAGGHNVLLSGTPGSGKTMLAKALPGILPPLTMRECLEVTKIYSIAGQLHRSDAVVTTRPFRAPHHSASAVALIGGGSVPRPGEVSLAHRGVLFLDECAEFPRAVIEHLRQPLEDGTVSVARVRAQATFPADFILLAATNPCPCGYRGDPERVCRCTPAQYARYAQKLSGPIMDRIDLFVDVPRVKVDALTARQGDGEESATIRQRVIAARRRQQERFAGAQTNSTMDPSAVERFCVLNDDAVALLRQAVHTLHLSARAYHRVIKVARTIADLDDARDISTAHIAEALQFRPHQDDAYA